MSDDFVDVVRERREALERVADSDLPAAWIAETLLEVADAEGES
ncbi:hypothetical protein [Halorarum halophilum]|nr:hypothetical protein [Halobaculum halophilum]